MDYILHYVCGDKEHRQLCHHPSQIQLVEKPGETAYLLYREDISKNHQGGLKNRKIKPKILMHHANVQNPRRCFVRLYKLCPHNKFYLQPLQKSINNLWSHIYQYMQCFSRIKLTHLLISKHISY